MNDPIAPALIAVVVGFGIAIVAFVPFVALSYRRRGEMSFWRSMLWLGAVIYAMALWTYTLVPFPESYDVQCVPMQTVPFMFVRDIADLGAGSVGALLHNPAAAQVVLNVVLFMPLGWFLRRLGDRGIVVATLVGFAVSALIEVTQLTGIWGLYSCSYRVFDVDDLIANTSGAFLGSLVGMLLWRRGQTVDAASPRPITVWRRALGMLCDVAFIALVGWLVTAAQLAIALFDGRPELAIPMTVFQIIGLALPLGIQLVSVLVGGVTVGERIVLIRARHRRLPASLSRPLRFLFGIGGYTLLLRWDAWPAGLLTFALFVTTVIMVFTTRSHRGFACVVSDIEIEDARASRAEATTR